MRLQFLRTAKPELAGGRWMVIDEDLPMPESLTPVYVGTAEQCGRFVDIAEHPVYAELSNDARMTIARNAARAEP